MARTRSTTVWPRTRSAGMVMLYRPCAFVPTEMFISVMNALPFSIGCPDSDTIRPVNIALWAKAAGALITTRVTAAVRRKTARDEDVRSMFTSGRVDADGDATAIRL